MFNQFTSSKLPNVLLFSLLLSPLTTLNAAQINTDSQIESVTVYPGSAKVTRVSKIKLIAGKNDLIINNLPLNLNQSSLRVSGEGQGSISLGSVEFSREIQLDVIQQREKDLRIKIENAQEKRRVIEDAITRNQSQLEYIKKMALGESFNKRKDEGQNGSYANLPLEQWQQAWQTLDVATKKAQEQIRHSNKELKENDKLLRKLNRELQQIATNQKEIRVAKLHVDSEIPTELLLKLTYQINGARWAPVYDADLDTQTGSIGLKTLAEISQRTGEDWKGVDITLSTLRPSAGTQLPQLHPWVLDFMPDMIQAESYSSGMALDEEVAANAPEPMISSKVKRAAPKLAAKKRIRQQQARLVSADFSAEYKVPSKITLSSGSNKRRFALNSQKISSKIKLASAPRYDPRAMILATSKYGNHYLNQKQSGEEIKLSFGEDDKVKINFLPDPDKKRKDGLLFGKKKVVERHYKVSITSNHDKAYPITISDVLPVSSHEDIKVKMFGDTPTAKNVDDKKGVTNWDMVLKPKAEAKIKYGYSVSYPEDSNVMGL